MGSRGANLPKPVHLSRVPQCALPGHGIAPAPVADCRLQTVRPRRICCPSTALCLAKPGHGIATAPVANCRLQTVRPRRICCPSTAPCLAKPGHGIATTPVLTDHSPRRCQFAPPAHPTRYYQTTRPGVPPTNPTRKPHPQNLTPQNGERRAHQTVDAASTPKGE